MLRNDRSGLPYPRDPLDRRRRGRGGGADHRPADLRRLLARPADPQPEDRRPHAGRGGTRLPGGVPAGPAGGPRCGAGRRRCERFGRGRCRPGGASSRRGETGRAGGAEIRSRSRRRRHVQMERLDAGLYADSDVRRGRGLRHPPRHEGLRHPADADAGADRCGERGCRRHLPAGTHPPGQLPHGRVYRPGVGPCYRDVAPGGEPGHPYSTNGDPRIPDDAGKPGTDAAQEYPYDQPGNTPGARLAGTIYTCEADKGAPPADPAGRVCLVLEGSYRGAVSFYRIDFTAPGEADPGSSGARSMPLYRNHRYIVSVTAAEGPVMPRSARPWPRPRCSRT